MSWEHENYDGAIPLGLYVTCYGKALVPCWSMRGSPRRPVVHGWAVIDEADIPLVEPYGWRLVTGYARSGRAGWMHRLIVGLPKQRPSRKHALTDHIDRDGLNNTRANLRITDHRTNMRNRRPNAFWSGARKLLAAEGITVGYRRKSG
jgi:hypothetical protein